MAQEQSVAVWVFDGDSPSVAVRVARGHELSASVDEPADQVAIEWYADVEDEKVFLGRLGGVSPWGSSISSRCQAASGHPSITRAWSALGIRPSSVEHLEGEPVSPEARGALQVTAGACYAQVTRRVRSHRNSILDVHCAR